MSNYKHIFKLEIIGGLALIQKEVCCDTYCIKDGTYLFECSNTDYCDGIIAQYPVVNTIIHSVDVNPDYIDPSSNIPRRADIDPNDPFLDYF